MILCLTVLGAGGTILLFFLFRACIRKASQNGRGFVSVLHLIVLALPVIVFLLQDLKILPTAIPNYVFLIVGLACVLLVLFLNIRLWRLGYGLAFTFCETFSALALVTFVSGAVYGIITLGIILLAIVIAWISNTRTGQQICVSKSPWGTDCFYVTAVNYGGYLDDEGNHYSHKSGNELLCSDGETYYIVG